MNSDDAIEIGSENVFADLGFADPEEELLKARIVGHLRSRIAERGFTQAEAAERLRLDRSDLAGLMRGRTGGISIERLLKLARLLGEDVVIAVSPSEDANSVGSFDLTIG